MVNRTKNYYGKILIVTVILFLIGCAGSRKNMFIEPGRQITESEVDIEESLVRQEKENIVVEVQGTILKKSWGHQPHPTFWITIQNDRDNKILVKPVKTRLINSFGEQLKPLPITVGEKGSEIVDYVLVHPEVHTYFSLHYGWPYYPFYPYRGWYAQRPFWSHRYWRYDPFWRYAPQPMWVSQIRARRDKYSKPAKEEIIYHKAKITYALVFPQLSQSAEELRLIIPEVTILEEENERTIDFEIIFDQKIEIAKK